MYKRGLQATEDAEIPTAKRRTDSGPHDTPKLHSEKLYSVLYDLVPDACLFTIIEPPSQTSMEQRIQQDQCAAAVTNNCNDHDKDGTQKDGEGQCEECASEHDEQHRGQDKEQHGEQDDEEKDKEQHRGKHGEQSREQDDE